MRILLTTLLCLCLLADAAMAGCTLAWRMHRLTRALTADPMGVATDPRVLRDLAALSRDGVTSALSGDVATRDLQKLGEFAAIAEMTGLAGLMGQSRDVQDILTMPQTVSVLRQTDSILAASPCGQMAAPAIPDRADPSDQTTRVAGDTAKSDTDRSLRQSTRELPQGFAIMSLLGMLLSGAAFVWAWRRLRFAQKERRRGARRYSISVPIEGIVRGKFKELLLLDLSGTGVKLKHSGIFEQGDHFQFKIDLMGLRDMRIMWMNDHYVGAKFENSLGMIEMAAVIHHLQTRKADADPPQTQNGARKAPSSL